MCREECFTIVETYPKSPKKQEVETRPVLPKAWLIRFRHGSAPPVAFSLTPKPLTPLGSSLGALHLRHAAFHNVAQLFRSLFSPVRIGLLSGVYVSLPPCWFHGN